jgi:hypothetical protein
MGVKQDFGDVEALGDGGTSPQYAKQSQAMSLTLGVRDVPSSQPKV